MGFIKAQDFHRDTEEVSKTLMAGGQVQGLAMNDAARVIGALVKRLGGEVFIHPDELGKVEGIILSNDEITGKAHIEAK